MRRAAVVLVVFVLALPAAAADEFGAVVKAIEQHYGIRRSHPHLLGFFMVFAKPAAWGSGAHGLKLAVFEDERRDFSASAEDLDSIVAGALGPKWQPFVRVRSQRSGETSVIYASFAGKQMRMIMASLERGEISLVHVRIGEKAIGEWMDDPESQARHHSHP